MARPKVGAVAKRKPPAATKKILKKKATCTTNSPKENDNVKKRPRKAEKKEDDCRNAPPTTIRAGTMAGTSLALSRASDISPPLRASGKRIRRRFDPNAWTAPSLTRRTNVLCLGMSYPCVRSQLREAELCPTVQLLHPEESVEQAVELVRRNVLTQMDGRDLARCLALEAANDTLAYTISMESGALYGRRHLRANFNRQTLAREIKKAWGPGVKFRQIILDYFWIPSGSWVMTHWTRNFFTSVLPAFVTEGLIDFGAGDATAGGSGDAAPPSLCSSFSSDDVAWDAKSATDESRKASGVVYLPFCLHCVKEIVSAISVLSRHYTISFVYKSELSEHALWAATSTISPDAMQSWLGKAIDQEETYCTFEPREFMHSADDAYVRKEDVLHVLRGVDNFKEVRMIKLRALRKFDPNYKAESTTSAPSQKKKKLIIGVDKGGFVGLKPRNRVVRGFDHVAQQQAPVWSESKTGNVEKSLKKVPNRNHCGVDVGGAKHSQTMPLGQVTPRKRKKADSAEDIAMSQPAAKQLDSARSAQSMPKKLKKMVSNGKKQSEAKKPANAPNDPNRKPDGQKQAAPQNDAVKKNDEESVSNAAGEEERLLAGKKQNKPAPKKGKASKLTPNKAPQKTNDAVLKEASDTSHPQLNETALPNETGRRHSSRIARLPPDVLEMMQAIPDTPPRPCKKQKNSKKMDVLGRYAPQDDKTKDVLEMTKASISKNKGKQSPLPPTTGNSCAESGSTMAGTKELELEEGALSETGAVTCAVSTGDNSGDGGSQEVPRMKPKSGGLDKLTKSSCVPKGQQSPLRSTSADGSSMMFFSEAGSTEPDAQKRGSSEGSLVHCAVSTIDNRSEGKSKEIPRTKPESEGVAKVAESSCTSKAQQCPLHPTSTTENCAVSSCTRSSVRPALYVGCSMRVSCVARTKQAEFQGVGPNQGLSCPCAVHKIGNVGKGGTLGVGQTEASSKEVRSCMHRAQCDDQVDKFHEEEKKEEPTVDSFYLRQEVAGVAKESVSQWKMLQDGQFDDAESLSGGAMMSNALVTITSLQHSTKEKQSIGCPSRSLVLPSPKTISPSAGAVVTKLKAEVNDLDDTENSASPVISTPKTNRMKQTAPENLSAQLTQSDRQDGSSPVYDVIRSLQLLSVCDRDLPPTSAALNPCEESAEKVKGAKRGFYCRSGRKASLSISNSENLTVTGAFASAKKDQSIFSAALLLIGMKTIRADEVSTVAAVPFILDTVRNLPRCGLPYDTKQSKESARKKATNKRKGHTRKLDSQYQEALQSQATKKTHKKSASNAGEELRSLKNGKLPNPTAKKTSSETINATTIGASQEKGPAPPNERRKRRSTRTKTIPHHTLEMIQAMPDAPKRARKKPRHSKKKDTLGRYAPKDDRTKDAQKTTEANISKQNGNQSLLPPKVADGCAELGSSLGATRDLDLSTSSNLPPESSPNGRRLAPAKGVHSKDSATPSCMSSAPHDEENLLVKGSPPKDPASRPPMRFSSSKDVVAAPREVDLQKHTVAHSPVALHDEVDASINVAPLWGRDTPLSTSSILTRNNRSVLPTTASTRQRETVSAPPSKARAKKKGAPEKKTYRKKIATTRKPFVKSEHEPQQDQAAQAAKHVSEAAMTEHEGSVHKYETATVHAVAEQETRAELAKNSYKLYISSQSTQTDDNAMIEYIGPEPGGYVPTPNTTPSNGSQSVPPADMSYRKQCGKDSNSMTIRRSNNTPDAQETIVLPNPPSPASSYSTSPNTLHKHHQIYDAPEDHGLYMSHNAASPEGRSFAETPAADYVRAAVGGSRQLLYTNGVCAGYKCEKLEPAMPVRCGHPFNDFHSQLYANSTEVYPHRLENVQDTSAGWELSLRHAMQNAVPPPLDVMALAHTRRQLSAFFPRNDPTGLPSVWSNY